MTKNPPPDQHQLLFFQPFIIFPPPPKSPLSSDLRVEIFTKDKKNRPGSHTALSTQLQARPAWHRIPLQRPGGRLGFSEWDLHSPKMEMIDYNSKFPISWCVYIYIYISLYLSIYKETLYSFFGSTPQQVDQIKWLVITQKGVYP